MCKVTPRDGEIHVTGRIKGSGEVDHGKVIGKVHLTSWMFKGQWNELYFTNLEESWILKKKKDDSSTKESVKERRFIIITGFIFFLGRKDSEDTPHPRRTQTPPMEEGEIPQTQEEEQEEEEDVVEIGTTTGDRDVRDRERFTSESAQILIGEIMGCNSELQNIQQKINDVIKKIITSLMFWGEFKPHKITCFIVVQSFKMFCNVLKSQIWRMHTVCQHVLSAITGDQWTRFGGATPSSIVK
ncbi:uncharacterized protein [Aquarana catesbeiana]|uniref:uncharacterized protein n=1 Tax=Aquarana catesbeiana TaxID=8400 RepID=UPI003CC97F71